jgi:hypothetical protein
MMVGITGAMHFWQSGRRRRKASLMHRRMEPPMIRCHRWFLKYLSIRMPAIGLNIAEMIDGMLMMKPASSTV